jgi:hypothetical protein
MRSDVILIFDTISFTPDWNIRTGSSCMRGIKGIRALDISLIPRYLLNPPCRVFDGPHEQSRGQRNQPFGAKLNGPGFLLLSVSQTALIWQACPIASHDAPAEKRDVLDRMLDRMT